MQQARIRRHSPLALAVALALAASGTQAATITVNSSDDSAASTFCNLRDAIASINNGSATTTCASQVSGDPFGTNDAILFDATLGGAKITLARGELAITTGHSMTIVGSGQTIDANYASRVLHQQSNSGITITVSGLTLKNGNPGGYGGGAITVDSAGNTLDLDSVVLSNNYSGSAGGALFLNDTTLNLTNSTVTGNTAHDSGGGIYAYAGFTTITRSTLSNNIAIGKGGGVMASSGNTLSIDHSLISGNTGARAGGVYPTNNVTATITGSTISGNSGSCAAGNFCAGGVYAYQTQLTVIDSTISDNHATGANGYLAGGAYLFNSTSTFVNSTITGNSAKGNDEVVGGLWELHDSAHTSSSLSLINCTVSANTASSYLAGAGYLGGGIMVGVLGTNTGYAGALTLQNAIVSGNSTPANADIVLGGGANAPTSAYSLLGTAADVAAFNNPANHNVFSDTPGLGVLQDNGGPTQTMAITSSSPAWRAGNAALAVYAGTPLNYDQRGTSFERLFSGLIDIGAYQDQGERIFANGFEPEP